MTETTQHERRTEIGAFLNVILSGLVALLLALIGFFAQDSFERINDNIATLQLDIRQLRTEMNALELGLRGDRFTKTDWLRERERLDREIAEIEAEIQAIRGRFGERG